MKPLLKFLSDEEIQLIHRTSIRILGDLGMRMPLEEALQMMHRAGARISADHIVKVPEGLVQDAIEKAPKRQDITLYGRDSRNDLKFDNHDPVMACMTMATHVVDPHTRKRRPATHADLAELTRVADHLDHIKINGGLVTPQDVPGEVNDWFTWATTLKNTSKHITGGVLGRRGVRDAVAMGSLAAGGEEAFLRRPFISGWVLTLPPLGIDENSLEALIEMSVLNIPSMVSSGPILGASSPVTIAGTVAQAHAEILACLVLSQVAHPGAPFVYTSFARGVDMRTVAVSMASPEFAILKVAMAQMGHFLKLPVRMPGMLRDAKELDAQAGFETGMVGAMTTLTSDIIDAMQLDSDLLVDFADLVFCNECMGALKRLAREVAVNEQTLATEVLKEVGHGGSFLGHDHTIRNFRDELWHPRLMKRRNWDTWEKEGGLSIAEVARREVQEILAMEPRDPLAPEVELQIDAIARNAESDFAGSV